MWGIRTRRAATLMPPTWLIIVAVVVAAAGVVVATPRPAQAALGPFTVSGNQILDGSGARFTVRGTNAIYGKFAGGNQDGFGAGNYTNAATDLDRLRVAGVNLIRLDVSADCYNHIGVQACALPQATYLANLDTAVSLITTRGLVAYSATPRPCLGPTSTRFWRCS